MAQKNIGYVELEWLCPNCQGKNPGSIRVCQACGSPQPENAQFQQKDGAELLKDEQKIAAASNSPDLHCPYCDTRNAADAAICSQCGGDLVEGKKREAGRVVGAATSSKPLLPIQCPHCGTTNPGGKITCLKCGALLHGSVASSPNAPKPAPSDTAKSPSPLMLFAGISMACCLLVFCVFAGMFVFRTENKTGTVQRVGWECKVEVLSLRDVNRDDWKDQIPQKGKIVSCDQKVRETVDQQVPNSKEVCGTPYEVDKGNGFAERVQDCEYQVYADYCTYTIQEWKVVKTLDTKGSDYDPYCNEVKQGSAERQGDTSLTFSVYFQTDSGVLEYKTTNKNLYQEFQPGSQWTLQVNSLGQVVDVDR